MALVTADLQAYIDGGYCSNVAVALSDEALYDLTMASPSMLRKRAELADVVNRHLGANHPAATALVADLLAMSVPPGLKGVLRGNAFNRLVADAVRAAVADAPHLRVTVEEKLPFLPEIPDFCVHDDAAAACLVGYNQLDLWSGGAQTNRGSKYVLNDAFHASLPPNVQVVSVVAQHIQLDSIKNKAYAMFARGVPTRRIVYPRHLRNFIRALFQLPVE
jgi:hypothetical protein